MAKSFSFGCNDLFKGICSTRMWLFLGVQDIKLRYRRSVIGPWWITITTAIMIGALGFLWSTIFNVNVDKYLPYFAIGQIIWNWISTQINDSCNGFSEFQSIIKQTRIPFVTYILRIFVRNLIILAHNLVILVVVFIYCGISLNISFLFAIPLFILVAVNVFSISIINAIFCTRYRDMVSIVGSVLQITFFVTPIIWEVTSNTNRMSWVGWNPVYHWLIAIRQPLLTGDLPIASFEITAVSALVSLLIAIYLLGRSKNRIVFWL